MQRAKPLKTKNMSIDQSSILPTFFEQLLRHFPCAKQKLNQYFSTEKFLVWLSFKKSCSKNVCEIDTRPIQQIRYNIKLVHNNNKNIINNNSNKNIRQNYDEIKISEHKNMSIELVKVFLRLKKREIQINAWI
jgi:hypothetical protein